MKYGQRREEGKDESMSVFYSDIVTIDLARHKVEYSLHVKPADPIWIRASAQGILHIAWGTR